MAFLCLFCSFLRTIPVPEDAIDCDFVQLFVNLLRRHVSQLGCLCVC